MNRIYLLQVFILFSILEIVLSFRLKLLSLACRSIEHRYTHLPQKLSHGNVRARLTRNLVSTDYSTESISTSNIDPVEFMTYWRNGFKSCNEEVCINISNTTIPSDLVGTYYKNGHAKFEIGSQKFLHPFDGDGMITAFSFQNGSILFRNRFVRTTGFVKERQAKKILFRNSFGTEKPGGMLANMFDFNIKNVANTNVIYSAGRLLALWEGGLPYKLEPDSLRTQGEYTFRGLLKKGYSFTAHPRVDPLSGNIVAFAVTDRGEKSKIAVYEFDENLKSLKEREFEIPGYAFCHDFAITENYYIFTQAPLSFDPLPFIFGLKPAASCISFDNSKNCTIHLVPRKSGPVESIPVENHFNFHYANAYEENGGIIIDLALANRLVLGETTDKERPIWEYLDYEKEVPFHTITRLSIKHGNAKTYSIQRLNEYYSDFPSVNPACVGRKHQYIFSGVARRKGVSEPMSGISKLDCFTGLEEKWHGKIYEIVQEPVVATKPNQEGRKEDDVYVLALLHNTKDLLTELVIFDGKSISAGPISRTILPVYVPYGLHGTFVPGLTFDPDEVQSRWKACNAIESKSWNKMDGGFSGIGISYDFK